MRNTPARANSCFTVLLCKYAQNNLSQSRKLQDYAVNHLQAGTLFGFCMVVLIIANRLGWYPADLAVTVRAALLTDWPTKMVKKPLKTSFFMFFLVLLPSVVLSSRFSLVQQARTLLNMGTWQPSRDILLTKGSKATRASMQFSLTIRGLRMEDFSKSI